MAYKFEKIYHYTVYLLLATLLVTGLSLARYAKTVTISNEARVARAVFEYVPVSASLNGVPVASLEDGIDISGALPGDELIYNFELRNHRDSLNNQVLLKYRITLRFSPDPTVLPLTYTLTPAGSYESAGEGWTQIGYKGEETHSYTLTVTWDEGEYSPACLDQDQTMEILITAEQLDN